ncbi:MAG: hypothetical protein KGY99_07535 [Phycisphaerae bacterium]|nr:hypothetical protein [Phycisphaerae bacterium]
MNGTAIRHVAFVSAVMTTVVAAAAPADDESDEEPAMFDSKTDLISLHYDHAPDRDDGQSAAADRTILQALFGAEWLERHVVAVSGAYGENARHFRRDSDAVMDAVWNDAGGWLAAHDHRRRVVGQLAGLWLHTLADGGDVWVKEGGQSDLTADVVRLLRRAGIDTDTRRRVHVVQHSNWNERQTTDADLAYTKKHTDYIRIKDANRFLNVKGGDDAFEKAARAHPAFGAHWRAAFDYYNPNHRLDFSDTGELMRILELGEVGIDAFRERFLTAP